MALFDLNPPPRWTGWLSGLFGNRAPIEREAAPTAAETRVTQDDKPRVGSQGNAGASSVFLPPGYSTAPAGDYPVWRAMDADPALTLSRAVITAPIREADKSYEAREGTPDEWVKVIQDAIDLLWAEYVREGLDALSMGWKCFEAVYGRREGRTVATDLVPLAQEITNVLVKDGAFVGLRNQSGRDRTGVDLLGPHALVVTIDGKNRNPYGRPWHENCRDAWWGKLQDYASLARLNRKASGIQGKGYFPPAADEDTAHTNENKLKVVLKDYMEGQGAVFPNASGMLNPDTAADYRNIKGMAENALWSIILEDHGNTGPQAMALLEQIRSKNTDLSRGWHVPERASQEANTAGSRADSESHANINLAMSQLVYADLCGALNRGPIDTMLVENYGEAARGAVHIKAGKLRDVFAEGDWKLIDAVLAKPDLFMAVAEQVDLDAVFTRRGIPKNKGVLTLTEAVRGVREQGEAQRKAEQAQIEMNPAGANANGTPVNGNGKAAVELARGAAWLGRMLGDDDDGEMMTLAATATGGDCGTGYGGFKAGNTCQDGGDGATSRKRNERPLASDKEWLVAKKQADAKIKNAPVPSKADVAKARAELELAKRGEGRAGGDSRGGSAASRRKQRENLFAEFGGDERGYVVCPGNGTKMHWTNDPAANPMGYPTFERGKIFVKVQGGGYQLPNLIPESFAANRSRNAKPIRRENMR